MKKPIVKEIMNPKLLYVRDGDRMKLVRRHILAFGVTAVPVLDDEHRPVGFVSLRDLADDEEQIRVSAPVETIREDETVEAGARKLALTTFHHLVVVDARGIAVGMVSAVDFLRALVGVGPFHPTAFDAHPPKASQL